MSVLIKGMEMPKSCAICGFKDGCEFSVPLTERPFDCPLVEVSEDVQPVKHGKNLKKEYPTLFQCSVCGCEDWDTSEVNYGEYNYCPNCGAKMDSEP